MVSPRKDGESDILTDINPNVKCNLNMNVNVSNMKDNGIITKNRQFIIICGFIFCTLFVIIYIYINGQTTQSQIDKLSDKITLLTRQYNEFININCKCSHERTRGSHDFTNKKSSVNEFSNLLSTYKTNDNSESDTNSSNQVNSRFLSAWTKQRNDVELNSNTNLAQNNSKALQITKTENFEAAKDEKANIDIWNPETELQIKRLRRDNRRGKKGHRKKNRPNRDRRRLGPLMATFIGATPDLHLQDTIKIGPWRKLDKIKNHFDFTHFHLVEDEMSIEVTTSGLYLISVQIFYYGELRAYSYEVLLNSEGKSMPKNLVTCATTIANIGTQVTCHTSAITYLQRGDRLRVEQMQKNVLVSFKDHHSYIQLVMLAGNDERK